MNDIQTIRTSKTYSEPTGIRPGHPDQDFESLLKIRTESYRAEKAKAEASENRQVKGSEDSRKKDIPEDIASLEEEKTGRSSGKEDEGQEDTKKEKDLSTSAYLIHDASRQQTRTAPSATSTMGQEAEEPALSGGHTGAGPLLEAAHADFAQRMKDDPVKEIPSISADTLQRMKDPAEAVKELPEQALPEQEGTRQKGSPKAGKTQPFLKSIQEAELKADSLKTDTMKKETLKPESMNRITEEMKNMEKAGSISQDPMETMETMEKMGKIRNLIHTGITKEEAGPEASEKDAGIEGLKGLTSAVRTGEARMVQETQKPEGQMAADRNMQMAATEIVHQVETLKDGDRTTIRVRLYPEEIGEMEITLSMEEGKLSGKILVENKEMRQVFTERLSELNQTLKACHIDVAKFEVGIGAGQQGHAGQKEQRQTASPARFMRYGSETVDREDIAKTVRTAARGIDLLA